MAASGVRMLELHLWSPQTSSTCDNKLEGERPCVSDLHKGQPHRHPNIPISPYSLFQSNFCFLECPYLLLEAVKQNVAFFPSFFLQHNKDSRHRCCNLKGFQHNSYGSYEDTLLRGELQVLVISNKMHLKPVPSVFKNLVPSTCGLF